MTTAYTTTQDITTPSVTLDDFTSVVPANIGVNVYGGALNADINTFDIGPTGGTNLLLQTLAAGNHHIHDGVCHDSATGTIPPDSGLGVHGIYDKAAGTLVENMEFYNHPKGQACSVRYGNAYKSNVYHDTPYSLAAFNYQGAALGPNGTPRFRDCIFYNLPAGGYVFYSDGIWRESNGTILGDSLFSIELDHATIDIRGMTNPFDFSACHNDVYLTNSIIISDSGLPLSSIITPPTDGSTVHLDGSIVLSSADAATYLGPAPTFTPIAVGGSPVIGTAVASPPASFAQWGNEGDLGATQTGSSPPGPPPLPGPGLPTLAYFEIGQGTAAGSDTLVIPVTADVPRSSPASATLIYIFFVDAEGENEALTAIVDDATPEDAYSLCIFEDGLNHYSVASNPAIGLIVNDLVNGVNNITLTFDSVCTFTHAIAIAVTGVGLPSTSPPALDPTLTGIATGLGQMEAPLGGGSSVATGPQWSYDVGGAVNFNGPIGATDENWDWIVAGNIAFYFVASSTKTADPSPWTWASGDIVDLAQFSVDQGTGFWSAFAIGVQDPVTLGAAAPTVQGDWGDLSSKFGTGGNAFPTPLGTGPVCGTAPGSGTPVFNNHIRLSE